MLAECLARNRHRDRWKPRSFPVRPPSGLAAIPLGPPGPPSTLLRRPLDLPPGPWVAFKYRVIINNSFSAFHRQHLHHHHQVVLGQVQVSTSLSSPFSSIVIIIVVVVVIVLVIIIHHQHSLQIHSWPSSSSLHQFPPFSPSNLRYCTTSVVSCWLSYPWQS